MSASPLTHRVSRHILSVVMLLVPLFVGTSVRCTSKILSVDFNVGSSQRDTVEDVEQRTRDTAAIDTLQGRLSRDEFTYAGWQRYTFLGRTPLRETEIDPIPTIALAAGYAGFAYGLHVIQANAWWADSRGPFHVVEDIEYAKGLDKGGHFFAAHTMSTLLGDMLMECGFNKEEATLLGGGMGLAYMTYVEVEDGFATKWGFSPSDAIANSVGVGFYVAQHYVPWLENLTPRWSYVPAQWTGARPINERPATFIDDYNSTTFWLAMDVERLLPNGAADIWPDWLMVSVGYGIRNYAVVDGSGGPQPVNGKFLIGLDYNWLKIIPEARFGFFNYVRFFLNRVRLPGPTLEISSEGTRFGLLYPFAIVIPF